jgi:hypothetical protein
MFSIFVGYYRDFHQSVTHKSHTHGRMGGKNIVKVNSIFAVELAENLHRRELHIGLDNIA